MSFNSFLEDSCKKILEHFGKDNQIDKIIEEMAELTKELLKNRQGKDNRMDIVEELGDILIMAKQIQLIYNIGDRELIETQNYKLARTLARYL